MKYKKQTTHKLFFGKYQFKIKCICKGSWMIKRLGIPETITRCLEAKPNIQQWNRNSFDPVLLKDFTNDVSNFLDQDINVRAEGSIFSIYCKDEQLFNRMCKKLDFWISEVFVPANDAEQTFLIDNKHKKIICNHLPYETYQYRVNLKSTMPNNIKEQFYRWILNYNGKIRAPMGTANWLNGKKHWVVNPTLYVKDGPTLSMVGLFLGERISSIQEFVPRSMINTISKEQPCPV